MIKYVILTFKLFPLALLAQQVTTIVNNPSTRFRDDLIFDNVGNLYCADYPGNSVYKRSPAGVVSIFASGFNTPNGLAFDSQQNLFVADNLGNRIYKLDLNGQFIDTFAILAPSGLIKMPNSDTILFTQYPGNSLSKLAPDGTVVQVFTGFPIDGAVGLAYSPDERLYLANFNNSQIFEVVFEPTVMLDSLASIPSPTNGDPWLGFIAYAKGYIWATAYNAHKIYKIDPSTGIVSLVAGSVNGTTDGGVDTARFSKPNGIVASASGDTLYVSDYGTGRLRMITEIPLNIDELHEINWEIYPNPVSSVLSISAFTAIDQIILSDMNGRLLFNNFPKEKTTYVDVSKLKQGVYFITINTNKAIATKRLLISR